MSATVKMYSGDTRRLKVAVLDESTGLPLDLTGALVEFALADAVDGSRILYKNNQASPGGIDLLSPDTDGIFVVLISPPDTRGLVGKYYFECMVTEQNGDVSTVLVGTLIVTTTLITP